MTGSERGPRAFLRRLQRAVNDHDIEALVSCFAEDYVNETPAHPLRGFSGRDQVRKNWTQIFAGVPDARAEVPRVAVDATRCGPSGTWPAAAVMGVCST
jgi:hypothetical protein